MIYISLDFNVMQRIRCLTFNYVSLIDTNVIRKCRNVTMT